MGAATGKPWLQHVHFVDPHTPYNASESYVEAELGALESTLPWDFSNPTSIDAALAAYDGATEETQAAIRDHLLAAYRAQITYFDDVLADFWSDLDSMGMLDDTLVVFWTDHGEQHGEHGEFHHGKSLHSQENRAMASFWARNLEPVEWTERTYHQDIASTLYDIMALTPGYTPTGHVVGTAPADRLGVTYNFVDNVLPEFSLIRGDSQLYYHHSGEKYFYDLAEDPDELHNLYDAGPAQAKRRELEQALLDWLGTTRYERRKQPEERS